MYIDGKKCQDLYDFFARKPPLAHGLFPAASGTSSLGVAGFGRQFVSNIIYLARLTMISHEIFL